MIVVQSFHIRISESDLIIKNTLKVLLFTIKPDEWSIAEMWFRIVDNNH